MKIKEVPQDNDPTYQGGRKLCYAMNEQGEYVPFHTSGWKVEETVKDYAWQMINADLKKTREDLRSGRVSSLAYFMKLRQMEPILLAQNMNVWSLRVRWHLRPQVFVGLSESWLKRYASCLSVPWETLRDYRGEYELTLD